MDPVPGFKTEIDKHIYLRNIQDTNETLFYRSVQNHLEEMMPVIYTPTVGAACERFSEIYRRSRGYSSLIRTVTTWTIFCRTCRTTISKSLW